MGGYKLRAPVRNGNEEPRCGRCIHSPSLYTSTLTTSSLLFIWSIHPIPAHPERLPHSHTTSRSTQHAASFRTHISQRSTSHHTPLTSHTGCCMRQTVHHPPPTHHHNSQVLLVLTVQRVLQNSLLHLFSSSGYMRLDLQAMKLPQIHHEEPRAVHKER